MAKKPMFAAGAFDDLRAASGETTGAPLRIAVNLIDEDPKQPRTTFDQAELEMLAESIRLRGVLQPIGVLPAEGGRHLLVFGARRLKASIIAQQADIPAVVVPETQRDLTTQVIENQQRTALSNSDLASVIEQLSNDGKTAKEIGTICNIPKYAVSYYRGMSKLPAFLAKRINDADVRAIYELSMAWKNDEAAIEAAVEGIEGYLSVTEARRIIQNTTGKASNSVFLREKGSALVEPASPSRAAEPEMPLKRENGDLPPAPAPAGREGPRPPRPTGGDAVTSPAPAAASRAVLPDVDDDAPSGVPVFIMETESGQRGVLVTSRRARTKGFALLDVQGSELEVAFSELRAVNAD